MKDSPFLSLSGGSMNDGAKISFGGSISGISGGNPGVLFLEASENASLYIGDSEIRFVPSNGFVAFNGGLIKEVATPEESTDAATKGYVDDIVGSINTLLDTINGEVI